MNGGNKVEVLRVNRDALKVFWVLVVPEWYLCCKSKCP